MSPSIQAAFLFLSSATAVSVGGARLSELSILAFAMSVAITASRRASRSSASLVLLMGLLASVLASTALQVLASDDQMLREGLQTAIAVPAAIVLAVGCYLLLDGKRAVDLAASYSRLALLICWGLLIWHETLGLPAWIVDDGYDARFSALSQNPNQLALYLLPVPFFAALAHASGRKSQGAMWAEIAAAVLLNLFIVGKGLLVAWLGAGLLMLMVGGRLSGRPLFTLEFAATRAFLGGAFAIAAIPLVFLLYEGAFPGSQAEQGAIRLALWGHGLAAWLESPWFGNGPGHYSGLRGAFEGLEAHNFLIDWLAAYGLFGVAPLTLFMAHACLVALKRTDWVVACLFVALLCLMSFHFYGRQPVFWLWWIFGLILSAELRRGLADRERAGVGTGGAALNALHRSGRGELR